MARRPRKRPKFVPEDHEDDDDEMEDDFYEERVMPEGRQERDLVLDPMQYAFIKDLTKGNINVMVGPNKTSLSNTDVPVVFSPDTKKFEECRLEQAVTQFYNAAEGSYLVLENPSESQPKPGPANSMPDLNFGRKVNLPGPIIFPLWPGQIATPLEGHNLRSNQYVLVRVYDEEAARANWRKAIIKPQTTSESENESEAPVASTDIPDLTTGQFLVIKGTEVSFYIPPTGVEVIPDPDGRYVRNAVTLERLDYCILLDENGNKRYVRGPDVVFPKPTESFLTSEGEKVFARDGYKSRKAKGTRKFKAFELNENSGLYIKVIADYEDSASDKYKVGDELFITGKDNPIYFPREEHSIIKYDEQQIHYAVAIPAGEGRYVLDRTTGKVNLVKGPIMFLPDPRKEVIVRRVLPQKMVRFLYPGNQEAAQHNAKLEAEEKQKKGRGVMRGMRARGGPELQQFMSSVDFAEASEEMLVASADAMVADDFERETEYSPPRTITLDTKYDGVVTINIWTGYAVLTVNKSGDRRVHIGPKTVMLEYDEDPEVLIMSTGKPKNTDDLLKTVYLRVSNNKVSDIIEAETSDLVDVSVKVSYRVNFEGDAQDQWFNVENYVKFLCDHVRSMLRGKIKQYGVEEFNQNSIEIIRDTVLGPPPEEGEREGRDFPENGMRIYDVEILDVNIGDESIEELLVESQHQAVSDTLKIKRRERELDNVRRDEEIAREIETEKAKTTEQSFALRVEEAKRNARHALEKIEAEWAKRDKEQTLELSQQEDRDKIIDAEMAREKAREDQRQSVKLAEVDIRNKERQAETEAIKERAAALKDGFVEALNNLGDKDFAMKVAEHVAPLAVLQGRSIGDALSDLARNLPRVSETVNKVLTATRNGDGNGEGTV
jgi:major vault protein